MNRMKTWESERLGKFSASQIHRLLVSGKTKNRLFGDTALSYIYEIVAEMFTGESKASVSSRAIEWGSENEAEAIEAYREHTGRNVTYFGKENPVFFQIKDMPVGGSPDALIEDKRVIEIKCPYDSANHIENSIMTVEEFKQKRKEYYAQVQMLMIVTNVMTADFCSFDPRVINDAYRLSVLEVPFDKAFCDNMLMRIREAAMIRNDIYNRLIRREAA